jgi:hypothetical protein
MGRPGTDTAQGDQGMATPEKKVLTFLVLTFALSTPLYRLIATAESIQSYSAWLMWTPGIAAILTQLLFTRGIAGLGWRIGKPAIFTPLTGATALTPHVIDELGIGLALAGVLIGYGFWRHRSALAPSSAI